MYWINRRFADGSESDFHASAKFAYEKPARDCAIAATAGPEPGIDGGECYLISDGTVIAHYVNGREVAL